MFPLDSISAATDDYELESDIMFELSVVFRIEVRLHVGRRNVELENCVIVKPLAQWRPVSKNMPVIAHKLAQPGGQTSRFRPARPMAGRCPKAAMPGELT